jgi:hypothetical protein
MTRAISCMSMEGAARRGRAVLWGVVGGWFALMLAGSATGFFESGARPPVSLGLAAVLPVVGFLLVMWWSVGFRALIRSLDRRSLVFGHTWRVGGFVFLVLWVKGLLPGAFAWSAGLGDMLVGITAPLVAMGGERRFGRGGVLAWHVVGMLDLVAAVSLAALSSEGPIGILAGDVTTKIMGEFPMSLIPTFFVPLLMILHLAAVMGNRGRNVFSE